MDQSLRIIRDRIKESLRRCEPLDHAAATATYASYAARLREAQELRDQRRWNDAMCGIEPEQPVAPPTPPPPTPEEKWKLYLCHEAFIAGATAGADDMRRRTTKPAPAFEQGYWEPSTSGFGAGFAGIWRKR